MKPIHSEGIRAALAGFNPLASAQPVSEPSTGSARGGATDGQAHTQPTLAGASVSYRGEFYPGGSKVVTLRSHGRRKSERAAIEPPPEEASADTGSMTYNNPFGR